MTQSAVRLSFTFSMPERSPADVRTIQTLSDNPIEIGAHFFEPLPGGFDVVSRGGEADMSFRRKKFCRKFLQAFAALLQWSFNEGLSFPVYQQVESDKQGRVLQ